MKSYYVCHKDHFLSAHHFMGESHFIDLEDGLILLCTSFRNEHMESIFTVQPGVSALPHPFSGETIAAHPHKALLQKHLPGLPDTAHSFHIGQHAKLRHPLMGPRF